MILVWSVTIEQNIVHGGNKCWIVARTGAAKYLERAAHNYHASFWVTEFDTLIVALSLANKVC